MISLIKKYSIKKLSDIIGQENNISFLQNSLFKNIFHPLYLFSGMRGTGKTSSARLFAASLLCEQLQKFQENPKTIIPCYECNSCLLYKKNQHPDIIELDAASNSGVETIRSIIDNAFILPVSSEKKIYIIDEVHMLSKAAFNACLKIMEEPPVNVHFILATTEIHKVLDTIKSRAIILHYKSVKKETLCDYLKKISTKENIIIEENAINLIVSIGEGSVRDTLNILNRLLLITPHITSDIVLEEYGLCDKQSIYDFIQVIIDQNTTLYYEKKKYITLNDQNKVNFFDHTSEYLQEYIQKNINEKNTQKANLGYQLLEKLYHYEEMFFSSLQPIVIFDLLLYGQNKNFISHTLNKEKEYNNQKKNDYLEYNYILNNNEENITIKKIKEKKDTDEKLLHFINNLEKIIKTIFLQGKITINYQEKKIFVIFQKNFYFYKDFLQSKESIISEAIHKTWEEGFSLHYEFDGSVINTEKKITNELEKTLSHKNNLPVESSKKTISKKNPPVIPESVLVNSIKDILPGETTFLLKENDHE